MRTDDGRTGRVFSIRLSDEQIKTLKARQKADKAPPALGPYIVQCAISNARAERAPATVLPRNPGAGRKPLAITQTKLHIPIKERVILDLCAGSGAWSAPYDKAGYPVIHVTLPWHDVRTYKPPANVYGILAAPPCDEFSMARNGTPSSPRNFKHGMETVAACMRIILQSQPVFWALENPTGHLSKFLGKPRDVFQPFDFGDPWTKQTALWGSFTLPTRGPRVRALGNGPFCMKCDPSRRKKNTWCSKKEHRAITAPGFARAFFEANP